MILRPSDFPPPTAFGAPPRFSSWRPEQADAVRRILESTRRFTAINAPTGIGKSLIAMMIQKLTGARVLVLTSTRGLQDMYCVAPETKILTSELRWIRADEVTEGQGLAGFDEEPQRQYRMWRNSAAEAVGRIVRPCYRLTFSDGTTVVCSSEHKWLASTFSGSKSHWVTAENLRAGGKYASKVVKLFEPWTTAADRDSGYLAAAFDGEGCLVQSPVGNGSDVNLAFSQRENQMLEEVRAVLDRRGITYRVYGNTKTDCKNLQLSRRNDVLRLLGECRPVRLLPKLRWGLMGAVRYTKRIALVKKEFLGNREVVAIKTTTGTFVAEGFASHNCEQWSAAEAFDIRGQRNYECVAVRADGPLSKYHRGASRVMVDRAPCHAGVWCRFKRSGGCEYYDAVREALEAQLVVTNYAYWMVIGSQLGEFDYLVLDEADEADAEVRGALHIELSHAALRGIGVDVPGAEVSTERWREWSIDARRRCAEEINDYTSALERDDAIDASTVAELRRLKDLQSTLDRIGKLRGEWLVAASRRGPYTDFDPIWPAPYCEETLFRGVERIVLMSATLTRKDLSILGVPAAESEFVEYDSPFPLASRPVYILDLGEGSRVRVDSRLKDYAWLVALMDSAISRRLDRKILIHSVSYKLTREIMRLSRYRHLMLSCASSDEKPQMLAEYRAAKAGAAGSILIHPGLKVGESFPMEECEVVMVPKVPFLDMRDPIMKRREAEDAGYGGHLMMKALVQSAGRHVRSIDDRGEVLVFDDHARWAVPKYRTSAPRAFMKALRWVKALPEPLPKL